MWKICAITAYAIFSKFGDKMFANLLLALVEKQFMAIEEDHVDCPPSMLLGQGNVLDLIDKTYPMMQTNLRGMKFFFAE